MGPKGLEKEVKLLQIRKNLEELGFVKTKAEFELELMEMLVSAKNNPPPILDRP